MSIPTIKSSQSISLLFSSGRRIHTPHITFIIKPIEEHDQYGRVAFIAGKKQGNAVWRNKAKRKMRSIYQEIFIMHQDYDVVFLAKSSISQTSYSNVLRTTSEVLKRTGFVLRVKDEGAIKSLTN